MSWGLKFGPALLGAVSLAALAANSAVAADLGGDCCADLEERVAELEATTVRKGNRKVSLEVSGQVNEALMFWDDGDESNVYVVTNDTSRTRFRFKGKAKIDTDWEAGYLLEIGVRSARSDRVDQGGPFLGLNSGNPASPIVAGDDGESNGLDLRHSTWYLKSKTYGQLNVGRTSTATDDITEANTANLGAFAKLSDIEDYFAGFQLRRKGVQGDQGLSALEWRRLYTDEGDQPGEGIRRDIVRYTSPTFAGFTASASWGEDDGWDAALRYSGEHNNFKIEAGIGYGENTDGPDSSALGRDTPFSCSTVENQPAATGVLPGGDADCNQLGGSISIAHVPTGVFVNFGAGTFTDERIDEAGNFANADGRVDDDSSFYHVQTGVEQKWNAFGKTTVYGEYLDSDGGANARRTIVAGDVLNDLGDSASIWKSEIEMFGAGIAQGIDAAAMTMYLGYRHFEADLTLQRNSNGDLDEVALEDLDVVMSGAIIKF